MRSWLEVLIVSSHYTHLHDLAECITETGAKPHLCSSVSEAQRILQSFPICLVFSDHSLPDGDFQDINAILASLGARIPVVYCFLDEQAERLPGGREEHCEANPFPYSREMVEQVIAGLATSLPESA